MYVYLCNHYMQYMNTSCVLYVLFWHQKEHHARAQGPLERRRALHVTSVNRMGSFSKTAEVP